MNEVPDAVITLATAWPILAFMGLQTVTVTWWAATQTQRVTRLEQDTSLTTAAAQRISGLEQDMKATAGIVERINNLSERSARMESTLDSVNDTVHALSDKLNSRRRT